MGLSISSTESPLKMLFFNPLLLNKLPPAHPVLVSLRFLRSKLRIIFHNRYTMSSTSGRLRDHKRTVFSQTGLRFRFVQGLVYDDVPKSVRET